MTIEGAPHLKPEHLSGLRLRQPCGKIGKRFLSAECAHPHDGRAQPFISGAISKTINMPHIGHHRRRQERLPVELAADAQGQRPLPRRLEAEPAAQHGRRRRRCDGRAIAEERERPSRRRDHRREDRAPLSSPAAAALPDRRAGYTQKARIGNHKIYLRTGEYEDGTLGEIFLDMHKEGAAFRSMTNCFAIAISLGLQHGVPLEEFVDAFLFTRFEPNGMVEGNPHIKMTTSIIDYIFRELAITYLGRHDLAHVTPPT